MKRSFFQAAIMLILLYRCTTWTLTKRMEKKLGGNYTRMLRVILNKSWRQHPTKQQLCGHLRTITKTINVRRTRNAGNCWNSRDVLISDELLWTPHMAVQNQDDQLKPTISSSVRIRDIALKTCQMLWTIGRNTERGSGISMMAARQDDNELVEIIIGNFGRFLLLHQLQYLYPALYLRYCFSLLLYLKKKVRLCLPGRLRTWTFERKIDFPSVCIKITTRHVSCQPWLYFYWVFIAKTQRELTLH